MAEKPDQFRPVRHASDNAPGRAVARLTCPIQRTVLPRLRVAPRIVRLLRTGALVVALIGLVHWLTGEILPQAGAAETPGEAAAASSSEPSRKPPAAPALERVPLDSLPIGVHEMRDSILHAVVSGQIEELRTAIEWNELPPDFGDRGDSDPIEFLRDRSADGEGREILAILANLLALPPALLPIGSDHENNAVYVWPYLSELKPSALSGPQLVELFRLVPADEAKRILERDKWTWYRLAIGADGTWHIFSKDAN